MARMAPTCIATKSIPGSVRKGAKPIVQKVAQDKGPLLTACPRIPTAPPITRGQST